MFYDVTDNKVFQLLVTQESLSIALSSDMKSNWVPGTTYFISTQYLEFMFYFPFSRFPYHP